MKLSVVLILTSEQPKKALALITAISSANTLVGFKVTVFKASQLPNAYSSIALAARVILAGIMIDSILAYAKAYCPIEVKASAAS